MMRQYELVERVRRYNPHADEDLLNRAAWLGEPGDRRKDEQHRLRTAAARARRCVP